MLKGYIGWDLESLDDPSVAKMVHVLKEGDRVRVKETGHVGTIQNLGQFNRVYVKLDSSHVVECDPRELEPADFPTVPNLKSLARERLQSQAEMVRGRIARAEGAGCAPPWGDPTSDVLLLAKLELWIDEDRMQKSEAAGDTLHKRASGFSVGDRVHERQPCVTGICRTGRVTKVGCGGILTIGFEGGVECMCVPDCVEAA